MNTKLTALGIGICLLGSMLGCGSDKPKASETEKRITVFAAASLTESLKEIGDKYMAENKNVKIVYNFDSSGTLKTQIQEGATCDIFISAGQKQMNQLDIKASEKLNPKKLDYILEGSRFNIVENKVVLVVPKNNVKNIKSYDDLVNKLKDDKILLAIGNSDVPVGQYTLKIFDFYKLDEKALAKAGKLTYGSNVKEVTTQIAEGAVDAGIIYQTDAATDKLKVVDNATKEMCGKVIYPAAILKQAKNQVETKKFFDYLKTDTAEAIFKKFGFTPVK